MVSAETINEVLRTLLTSEKSEAKSSVRRAQRVDYTGKVHLTFTEASEPGTMVRLHDISARGISFPWPRELAIGTNFTARLERPDGGTLLIGCEVVHCRPREQGTFNIGAEFKQIIDQGPINSAA